MTIYHFVKYGRHREFSKIGMRPSFNLAARAEFFMDYTNLKKRP
jgi:hypothetical protein